MNTRKAIQIGCALILGLAMYIPGAHADARDEQAYFTFSCPVEVSSTVTLPAGRYMFRLADMLSYPNNVMRIYDHSGSLVTTVVTEVTDRATPATWSDRTFTKTNLEFAEGTDHVTLIKYFYKDDNEGHRFTYSAQRERALSEEPMVTIVPAHESRRAPNSLLASNSH